MGLTSAMYTGLTGLQVNQTRIQTIGHNIANVNTNAFKGSRTLFQTLFSRTMSMGTAPSDNSGGTNPMQIGLGASVGTTQRIHQPGAFETTGLPSDLAVEGAGFFVVQSAAGKTYYTRDGAFVLNSNNELVNQDGHYVQGFGIDDQFNVVPGTLTPLRVPIGELSIAQASENVQLDGDLSAGAGVALQGSVHTSQALVTGGGGAATAGTLLTDVRAAASPGARLFADGDTITISGAARGDRSVGAHTFVVGTDGTTLGDLGEWMEAALGIQTPAGVPGTPGVTVENGTLVIRSNNGEPNAIDISTNDLTSSNANAAQPLQLAETQAASGGGVFTSFTVYDSLGAPVTIDATFTLDETPNTGPVWRYYLEEAVDGGTNRLLGTGTVAFNTQGAFVSAAGNQVSIDRSNTGAASPLTVTLDFSDVNGQSTQDSDVIMSDQDGFPPGTLSNFSVGTDGVVSGVFSNGLTRDLGQVAVATFANDEGLVAETDNLYTVGVNSGEAQVLAPGSLGAGLVRGGTLELSNVDLSNEFIGLITSSTGYQAASRVISVSNELLDQLLLTLR
jgi:flagellar hook protein FlgE